MPPDALLLQPIACFAGTLKLPGSKSLSNRHLLLAALAQGATTLSNLLDSDDVRVMVAALRELGVRIDGDPVTGSVTVQGRGGPLPGGTHRLHLGNAGTAMRPLTAVLAAGTGDYRLEGVPRMHERPIGDLVAGLRQLGAHIDYLGREGFPPLRLRAAGLHGGRAAISGRTSSQFLSALLLAAPLARGDVTLVIADELVSRPYVHMTLALMERYGVRVREADALHFLVPAGQRYRAPGALLVEGDASSASYFLAGAAITGGTVRVEGCGTDSLQGDARFAEVLARMGAQVRWEPGAIEVTGAGGALRAVDADLVDMPDAAMTLAVAALFADGPCTLRGIANWRVKETDRMAAVSTELHKLGARTEVGPDSLRVMPPARLRSASIETYNDHRMAMAFSLAACGGVPVTIQDPACVAKTFPTFFEALAQLTAGDGAVTLAAPGAGEGS
ncbi:MAG: 3-phosphoshikimate 1-carboxyvinyltransferase [Candidatus Lambdaproteobacteria bacterium]|nr:3-phosphoshikimate 1-carboxyvinyltransferase [Candidatus Lambdaproteobacteria bacterium]